MPELPSWLTAVISSGIAAAITWFASRRLYAAAVEEKGANTSKLWAGVAEDAVRQLRQVRDEIPVWMEKLAAETARADAAEKHRTNAAIIQEQAKIIVEEVSHLSYLRDPDDETESIVERRFRNIKAAAKKIAECEMGN
jgi:hypothetical protein